MEKKIEDFLKLISNSNYDNIHIVNYDNLKLIYTSQLNINLHHSNLIIDFIIHNIDFIITDNNYNLFKDAETGYSDS